MLLLEFKLGANGTKAKIVGKKMEGNCKKNSTIRSVLRGTGKWLVWFLLTLSSLFALFVLSAAIPRYRVRENLLASANYLFEEEELFHQWKVGDRRTEIHNYADATTLNILYSIDGEHKIKEILQSPFYSNQLNPEQSVTELLVKRVAFEQQADTLYDRYWHGMILVLRPLLVLFRLQQIRWIFLGLLLGSMVLLTIVLLKKGQKAAAAFVWLGAALVQLPVVAFCIEYFPVFLITFLIAIFMVHWEKRRDRVLGLCVVSGTCVAFFDFLTTETVAFVLPMALVYCVWEKQGTIKTVKEELRYVVSAGISWAGAYVFTYLVKWSLSSLVCGKERFSVALAQFAGRQGNVVTDFAIDSLSNNWISPEAVQNAGGNVLPQFLSAVVINVRLLLGLSGKITLEGLALLLVFAGFTLAAVVYLFRKPGKIGALPTVLFLLGAVPILRMLVLHNHSIEHCFFVYRALYGTIFCWIAGVIKLLHWECLQRRKANGC